MAPKNRPTIRCRRYFQVNTRALFGLPDMEATGTWAPRASPVPVAGGRNLTGRPCWSMNSMTGVEQWSADVCSRSTTNPSACSP